MLNTCRLIGKTISCLKHKENNSKFLSYHLKWDLFRAFALPYVPKQKFHGLTSIVEDENIPRNCTWIPWTSPKHHKQIRIHNRNIISKCMSTEHCHSCRNSMLTVIFFIDIKFLVNKFISEKKTFLLHYWNENSIISLCKWL